MSTSDWVAIGIGAVGLLQCLITGVLGFGIKTLRDIRDHLATLNGRTTRLEERISGHETLDDDRFESLRDRFDKVDRQLERILNA